MPLRLILAAMLACLPALANAATFQGRDYILTDARRDARPAPLVLVLHGFGGTGAIQQAHTGFDRLARRAGVVAVYPSAPRRQWNDGRFGATGGRRIGARDDAAWFRTLVADLAARGIVDPGQVHVIGHSNGGGMAMRLACEAEPLVRAIAVVATKELPDMPCAARHPVPAVFFHGTRDPVSPHGGDLTGEAGALPFNTGASLSSAETLARWAERNGCAGSRTARIDPADDGVSVVRRDFTGCTAALRYFEIEGGGHGWPGARRGAIRPRAADREPAVRDIDAGAEALRFWFGG
jgi:polyhydroxybutyrate depolymerase